MFGDKRELTGETNAGILLDVHINLATPMSFLNAFGRGAVVA